MSYRVVVPVLAVVLALFATGSALAFECYNTNRSERGNDAVAEAPAALLSIEEILANPDIVGLCPEGVDFVIEGLEEEGFRTDVLLNFHALMAGGLEKNGQHEDLLQDGKGIDHLSEGFFETADALIGEAFGICED